MTSADLLIQDKMGDAIEARLATDSLTADVIVNPAQAGTFPYVVIGTTTENDNGTTKTHDGSEVTHLVTTYSDSLTEAKQIKSSILNALTRVTLDLSPSYSHIDTRLESSVLLRDTTPEGKVYGFSQRFRFTVHHT